MTTASTSLRLDDDCPAVDPLVAVQYLSDPSLVRGHGVDLTVGIVAAERLVAWAQAVQMTLMTALAEPGVAGDCLDMTEDALSRRRIPADELDDELEIEQYRAARSLASAQLAAVLHIAPVTIGLRLDAAVEIVRECPATHQSLLEGRIDRTKAIVIAERTRVLGPEHRPDVEAFAARVCAGRTCGKSVPLIDQAVMAADPLAAENRRKTAVRGRRIERTALGDGMGLLSAFLAADKADTVFELFDAVARATKGLDDRGVDARRADALTDLAELLLSGASVDLSGILGTDPDTSAPTSSPTSAVNDDSTPGRAGHGSGGPRSTPSDPAGQDMPLDRDLTGSADGNPSSADGNLTTAGCRQVTDTTRPTAPDDGLPARPGPTSPGPEATAPVATAPAPVATTTSSILDSVSLPADSDLPGTPDGGPHPEATTTSSSLDSVGLPADSDLPGTPDGGPHPEATTTSTDLESVGLPADSDLPGTPDGGLHPEATTTSSSLEPVSLPADSDLPGTPRGGQHPVNTTNSGNSRPGPASAEREHPSRTDAPCPAARTTDLRGWTLPRRQGQPVHLTVTLTLDALLGLRDDPAVLQGWGAITADWARTLARAAGSVTLLVTDPTTGAALGASARTYRPRQSVRDQIITTHPTCVFLGCSVPAVRCDLDHRKPFDHDHPDRGGLTEPLNLDPLCRHHHRLKTHGGWTYTRRADQALDFHSPLGLTTRVPPPTPLLPASAPPSRSDQPKATDVVVDCPPF